MSSPTSSPPSSSSHAESNPFTSPTLPRRPSGRRKPVPAISDSIYGLPNGPDNPRPQIKSPPSRPVRPKSLFDDDNAPLSDSSHNPLRSPYIIPPESQGKVQNVTNDRQNTATSRRLPPPIRTGSRPISGPPLPPRPDSSRPHILTTDAPITYLNGNIVETTRLPPPPPSFNEKGFPVTPVPGRRCYPTTKRGIFIFWGVFVSIALVLGMIVAIIVTVSHNKSGSPTVNNTDGGHPLSVAEGGVSIGKPGELATFGINSTDHFVMVTNRSIVVTRLDPVVSPGGVSAHVHRVHGSSYFTQNLTKASDMINLANCTTAYVQDDKSLYWVAQLYYRYPNGSMVAIPMIQTSVYYFQKAPTGVQIHPFPDNYNIVTGDPNRRVVNASDPAQAAAWWVCHRGAQGDLRTNGFPDSPCPIALKSGIMFPSCWDGIYAENGNYSKHVAYPTDGVNGYFCPAAFPKKFIGIQFETYFGASNFPFNGAGSNTWVLSNGDTSGLGVHGDFMNGWKASTLQGVLDDCRYMNGTTEHPGIYAPSPENCPHLNTSVNLATTYSCHLQTPIVNEAVGEKVAITSLPGCNAIWNGNVTKPPCPNGTVPGGELNLAKPSVWYHEEPYIN